LGEALIVFDASADSAVDFPSVPNIKDSNLLGRIVNTIENTIVGDSNPPSFFKLAFEEFRTGRARIFGQCYDRTVDSLDDRFLKLLKFLCCPSVD